MAKAEIDKAIEAAYTEAEDKNEEPGKIEEPKIHSGVTPRPGRIKRKTTITQKSPITIIPREGDEPEATMEEDKPVVVEKSIGRPRTRYLTFKKDLEQPAKEYSYPDSTFYQNNYKKILKDYVENPGRMYENPKGDNYQQVWDVINKVRNSKTYISEEKSHRKDYQQDLIFKLHNRNVEQLMDRYNLTEDPDKKKLYKYAGIAAEKYLTTPDPEKNLEEDPQYILYKQLANTSKKKGINPQEFIDKSEVLYVDNNKAVEQWEKNAFHIAAKHERWDKLSQKQKEQEARRVQEDREQTEYLEIISFKKSADPYSRYKGFQDIPYRYMGFGGEE